MLALTAYRRDMKIEKIETEEEKEIIKKITEENKKINKKLRVRHTVLKPKKKRGTIKSFSKETAKRIKFWMNNNDIEYKSMITLTYPIEMKEKLNGVEVKYHLNRFTKRFKLNNYIWVMEFQKNGNPHFHILTDNEYKEEENKKISQIWYEIVDSNLEKHLNAGTRNEKLYAGKEGASSYIRKYVSKKEQKRIPKNFKNVGKLWGKGGERKLKKEIISIDENVIDQVKEIYIELIKDKISEETKKIIKEMKYCILWNMTKEII